MKMSVCDKVLHWKSMFIDMFKKMIIVVDIRGFLWWSRCSYSDVSHKRFRLCGKGSTIYCWERDLRQSYLVFRGSPLNFKSNSYHKRNEMWYIPTKMDKIFLKFIKLIIEIYMVHILLHLQVLLHKISIINLLYLFCKYLGIKINCK